MKAKASSIRSPGKWLGYLFAHTFLAVCLFVPVHAQAESLMDALSQAYVNNPQLNAERAGVRATDESVPQALSGYRPRVIGGADAGLSSTNSKTAATFLSPGGRNGIDTKPRGVDLSLEQPLFDGFRTTNAVRVAKSSVLAAREGLRNTEQNVLFSAVEAYMNVLRDFAIYDLRRNNVNLLGEELGATRERFDVGEVTRTDVAQSESRQAGARAQLSVAEANLKASRAVYRQIIGVEPTKLYPGKAMDKLLPRSLDTALDQSYAQHPAILAAFHGVDAAALQVKVIEGELYPSVSVEAGVQSRWEASQQVKQANSASLVGRLTVPIYQGGQVSSRIREAKELQGQRRLEADVARDSVRAAVVSAWGSLEGAKSQIAASQAQVDASQIAINGVREEAKVGQRTTLDVLNAQQELLDARVNLIVAQRDRVVASYALLQAIGRLSADKLGLNVQVYQPQEHYEQVRDKWSGLRTPDGR